MNIEFPNLVEIERIIFETALQRYGPSIRSSKKIAPAIIELSDFYNTSPKDRGACPDSRYHQAARMMFFTLADMPKAYVTAAEADALVGLSKKERVKVLDLGVGYGAQSLGLLAYLFQMSSDRRIQLDAVDRDAEALEAFEQVLMNCQHGQLLGEVIFNAWRYDLNQEFLPRDQYDLIVIGNTVCELQAGSQYRLLEHLLSGLKETGIMIVLEPALKATSRNLHHLRDQLLAREQCKVIAPCTRQGNCPCLLNPKDWCHESRSIVLPPHCRQLAMMTGLRMDDLKWSYMTLTRQTHSFSEETLSLNPSLREQEEEGLHPEVWRVVSDLFKPKGKQEIFLCGPQGRLRAVLQKRDRTPANKPFKKLRRGQLVWIREGTVKDNYLVLDRGSSIDRIEDPAEHVLL